MANEQFSKSTGRCFAIVGGTVYEWFPDGSCEVPSLPIRIYARLRIWLLHGIR